MRKTTILPLLAFLLFSCDIFGDTPPPIPILTPVPSNTPVIVTLTPLIIMPPTMIFTTTPDGNTSPSLTPPPTSTFTPGPPTPTITQPIVQSVDVAILGCDTSFDIQNGMFEVTNAYVTLKNTGTVDLPNTCALLRANDEGREHPDKKVCPGTLPVQNQVTLKLTVDSTYKENTMIQVDVTTNETILLRVDKTACRNIELFGGVPVDVGVIKPAGQ